MNVNTKNVNQPRKSGDSIGALLALPILLICFALLMAVISEVPFFEERGLVEIGTLWPPTVKGWIAIALLGAGIAVWLYGCLFASLDENSRKDNPTQSRQNITAPPFFLIGGVFMAAAAVWTLLGDAFLGGLGIVLVCLVGFGAWKLMYPLLKREEERRFLRMHLFEFQGRSKPGGVVVKGWTGTNKNPIPVHLTIHLGANFMHNSNAPQAAAQKLANTYECGYQVNQVNLRDQNITIVKSY